MTPDLLLEIRTESRHSRLRVPVVDGRPKGGDSDGPGAVQVRYQSVAQRGRERPRRRRLAGGQIIVLQGRTNAPGQHAIYGCPTDTEEFGRAGFVAVHEFQDICQVA